MHGMGILFPDGRTYAESLQLLRCMVLHFCMAGHARLGRACTFQAMDWGIFRMVGTQYLQDALVQMVIDHEMDHVLSIPASIGGDTSSIYLSHGMRSRVAEVVASRDLLLARIVRRAEQENEEGGGGGGSWERLGQITYDIRREYQQHCARLHRGGEDELLPRSISYVLELHPRVAMPDHSMGMGNRVWCRLCEEDFTDEPSAESRHRFHPAHLFLGNCDSTVEEHVCDSIFHLEQAKTTADMLPWIAELCVLQICVFPIADREHRAHIGASSQFTYSCGSPWDGRHIFVRMCHGDHLPDTVRHRCTFSIVLKVYSGGRRIGITFEHLDEEEEEILSADQPWGGCSCACCWCMEARGCAK